jgi:hypothetical protein
MSAPEKLQNLVIPEDLLESLGELSQKEGLTVQQLAEKVLHVHVAQSSLMTRMTTDRRRFQRKSLHNPAVVCFDLEEVSFYKTATMLDLSLSGACLHMEKAWFLAKIPPRMHVPLRFDLLFDLPGVETSLAFGCQGTRHIEVGDEVYFGAEFVHSFHESHLHLQRYLSQTPESG